MSTNKRKYYDKEFKKSTVKLILKSGKSVRSISSEIGVNEQTLHKWKKAYLGKGENKLEIASSEEIGKLRKELERVTMERDILKKALAFFSRESEEDTGS